MKKSYLLAIIIVVIVLTLAAGAFLLFREMNSIPKPGGSGGAVSSRPAGEAKITNFLMVCVEDRDEKALSPFMNSDGILLVSVNESAKKIIFVSFDSSTQVKVSHAYDDTLDHVFRDGGVNLLKKTLEENFGVTADHYALMKAGDLGELAGEDAASIRDLGAAELVKLAKNMASKAETDMSSQEMLSFASKAANMNSYKASSLTVPKDGSYTSETDEEGKEILAPDLEANRSWLEEKLRG